MLCYSTKASAVVYPDSGTQQSRIYEQKLKTFPSSHLPSSSHSSIFRYLSFGKVSQDPRIDPSSMAISLESCKNLNSTKGTQSISRQPSIHVFVKPKLLKELSRELSNLKVDLLRANSQVSFRNISSRKERCPTMRQEIDADSSSKNSTKEMVDLLDNLLHSYLEVTATNQNTTNTIRKLLTKLHCFELVDLSDEELREILSQVHQEFSLLIQEAE